MPNLIDIIFKLINMIVLSCLFLRLFCKYVLPLLKAEMESDNASFLTLENKKILLSEEKNFLHKNIQKEILEQEILKQKLLYWNSVITQTKTAAHLTQQHLADALYERKIMVKKKQFEKEMEKEITDTAILEAEKALQNFFSNEQKGTEYIVQVIEQSSLKEGS